jgi:hypothetical protein
MADFAHTLLWVVLPPDGECAWGTDLGLVSTQAGVTFLVTWPVRDAEIGGIIGVPPGNQTPRIAPFGAEDLPVAKPARGSLFQSCVQMP